MNVELTNAIVTIKEELTWGDTERIKAAGLKMAKMSTKVTKKGTVDEDVSIDIDVEAYLEMKYVTLERLVVKIVNKKSNQEVPFSREWMDGLTPDDGNALYEAVDSLAKKDQRTTATSEEN